MKEHRRSLLQARILIQLQVRPTKTIAELAELIGTLRPSASRSLHALKEQGLIFRDRNGWRLTESGEGEASKAKASFVEMAEKLQTTAERAIEVWSRTDALQDIFKVPNVWSTISETIRPIIETLNSDQLRASFKTTNDLLPFLSVATELAEGINRQLDGVAGLAQTLGKANAATDLVANIRGQLNEVGKLSEALNMQFSDALTPLLEAQEVNNELLGRINRTASFTVLEEAFSRNNLLLASIIDDAFAIRRSDLFHPFAQMGIYPNMTDLVNVNQSFKHLFTDRVSNINLNWAPSALQFSMEPVVVPTATLAYYTKSVRSLADPVEISTPEEESEYFGDVDLDNLLLKLNPDFVEMRRGAWVALHSEGPDYLRQASASARELLRQLLELLVPTNSLPEDKRTGPRVKDRLRIILKSESDIEYVDSMCKALLSQYDQLNKYTHHNKKHKASCWAILQAGEGVIRFILVQTNIVSE